MKRIIFAIICVLISFVSIADAGLVGYWNFDEGQGNIANDSSILGNNAQIDGPTWTIGKYGNGLLFDRIVLDRVIVPYNNTIELPSDFTLMLWLKYNPSAQDESYDLIDKAGQFLLQKHLVSNTFVLDNGLATDAVFGVTIPPKGEWINLAAVYDSKSNISLYYNGVLDGSTPVTTPHPITNYNIQIGNDTFDGTIDEVRIYNNALTQDEILRDMNSASSVVPEPSTVLLFGTWLVGFVLKKRRV